MNRRISRYSPVEHRRAASTCRDRCRERSTATSSCFSRRRLDSLGELRNPKIRDSPRAAQIRRQDILVELRQLSVRLGLAGDRLPRVGVVTLGRQQCNLGARRLLLPRLRPCWTADSTTSANIARFSSSAIASGQIRRALLVHDPGGVVIAASRLSLAARGTRAWRCGGSGRPGAGSLLLTTPV